MQSHKEYVYPESENIAATGVDPYGTGGHVRPNLDRGTLSRCPPIFHV